MIGARHARMPAAALLLIAGLGLVAAGAVRDWHASAQNAAIARLMAGQDLAVEPDAPPALLAARARALIARGNLDGAQAIADRLAASAPAGVRAPLLYALGNAHMRHAFAIFTQLPFRQVRPFLSLAKSEYRQALQLDPGNWDARYNYAIAASLVRDTEHAAPSVGDQMAHERAAWPDIPGAPNGMP
jgi:mxaK protein